jgi:predicted nucleic acid-binding protein
MPDVALDANVLVGLLDQRDTLHLEAESLVRDLAVQGRRVLLLDVCVSEAISVLCRRAAQRKTDPPDLDHVMATVKAWHQDGQMTFVQQQVERCFLTILGVVEISRGVLNFNDAFLAVLQREDQIGDVASFDRALDEASGFRRIEGPLR